MQNEKNSKKTTKKDNIKDDNNIKESKKQIKDNSKINKNQKRIEKGETLSKVKNTNKKSKNVDISVLDKEIKTKLDNIDSKKENSVIKQKDKEIDLSFSLFEVVLMIIISILSCILIFHFITPEETEIPTEENNEEIVDDYIDKFLEQYNYILENYYGNITKEELINGAIQGMLSTLDEYSEVIDQDSNTFSVTLNGEYEGLGIAIYNDLYGNIVIDKVYEDTPASKAGLKTNDIIRKFNDKDLTDISSSELVDMIANAGDMTMTILRNDKEIKVTLKKEKIVLKSVNYKMLKNKVGYIDVDIFAVNTYDQFEKALNDLESQKMKSLIIDLRDNTGGHLSAVEQMLYLFLDKSNVIYQTEDKNGVEKFYSLGDKDKKYKIVILQNETSASASEIMSSALKENLNAYIIGKTSFGKGTVQLLKEAGDLQYKFTTKRWLTPNGNWINEIGVKADLEIDLSAEYYKEPIEKNDNQLNAAIEYLNK